MNRNKRPFSVSILGYVYIGIGAIGFAYHWPEFLARPNFLNEAVWVELTEVLAIVCGVFLLRGCNWARWVALTWIGFHVALSAFHTIPEFAIHCLFCAVIAWFLFRREAARYFLRPPVKPA